MYNRKLKLSDLGIYLFLNRYRKFKLISLLSDGETSPFIIYLDIETGEITFKLLSERCLNPLSEEFFDEVQKAEVIAKEDILLRVQSSELVYNLFSDFLDFREEEEFKFQNKFGLGEGGRKNYEAEFQSSFEEDLFEEFFKKNS